MPNLLALQRDSSPDVHSLREWGQIEDPGEVQRVLDRIQATTHLDVYKCAELYELAYPGYEGDLDYYLEKGVNGHVLYLGVGAGRIFSHLAQENPDAIGIDNSPEMLELLRRRHPHVQNRQVMLADAVTEQFPESHFDSVVAPYSFLQVVEEKQLSPLLKNVHRSLKPGGQFHTDTFSPYLIPFQKPGLEASIRRIGMDTRVAIFVLYDHLKQAMKEMALICRDGDEKMTEMDLQYYFPRELIAAMEDAGFEDVKVSGGYQGEPFNPIENEVLVYEARRAVEEPVHRQSPSGNGRKTVGGNGSHS
ncbi:MAG: methyltransferase domain-containing protein [Candidatus Peribacteraceae bacterium]|jgi:ubiquinone/menaquinone biosynthesis C-methylase UbiE